MSTQLALLALNRQAASRFAVPGADVCMLFAGAPSYREPSGVLEAMTMEMPLVEVGRGEFYACRQGGSWRGPRLLIAK